MYYDWKKIKAINEFWEQKQHALTLCLQVAWSPSQVLYFHMEGSQYSVEQHRIIYSNNKQQYKVPVDKKNTW